VFAIVVVDLMLVRIDSVVDRMLGKYLELVTVDGLNLLTIIGRNKISTK